MRGTASAMVLIRDAVKWWESKRPAAFSKTEHIGNPTVNCASEAESTLARSVALYVEGCRDG